MVFSVKQTGVPVGGVIAGLAVPGLTEAAGPAWALLAIAALCLAGAASGEWLRGALDLPDVEVRVHYDRRATDPARLTCNAERENVAPQFTCAGMRTLVR